MLASGCVQPWDSKTVFGGGGWGSPWQRRSENIQVEVLGGGLVVGALLSPVEGGPWAGLGAHHPETHLCAPAGTQQQEESPGYSVTW